MVPSPQSIHFQMVNLLKDNTTPGSAFQTFALFGPSSTRHICRYTFSVGVRFVNGHYWYERVKRYCMYCIHLIVNYVWVIPVSRLQHT